MPVSDWLFTAGLCCFVGCMEKSAEVACPEHTLPFLEALDKLLGVACKREVLLTRLADAQYRRKPEKKFREVQREHTRLVMEMCATYGIHM